MAVAMIESANISHKGVLSLSVQGSFITTHTLIPMGGTFATSVSKFTYSISMPRMSLSSCNSYSLFAHCLSYSIGEIDSGLAV